MTLDELSDFCKLLDKLRVSGHKELVKDAEEEVNLFLAKNLGRVQSAEQFLVFFRECVSAAKSRPHFAQFGEEMSRHALSLLLTFEPGDYCSFVSLLGPDRPLGNHTAVEYKKMVSIVASCALSVMKSFDVGSMALFCRLSGDISFCLSAASRAHDLLQQGNLAVDNLLSLLEALSDHSVCSVPLMKETADHLLSELATLTVLGCRKAFRSFARLGHVDEALISALMNRLKESDNTLMQKIALVHHSLSFGFFPEDIVGDIFSSPVNGECFPQHLL